MEVFEVQGMSFGVMGMSFGVMGMSLGTVGFVFGLISFVQTKKLTKTLKEKGILEEN